MGRSSAESGGRTVTFVGIGVMLLGLLAMFGPQYTGIAVTWLLGILLIFAGLLRTTFAWVAVSWGNALLRFAMGILAIVAGGYILANPESGLRALTLALAILFAADGISAIILALRLPPLSGAGWVILDGVVSVVVAALIWSRWPSSADWAVGVIIGIKLFIDGLAITAIGMTVKHIGAALADNLGGAGGE
jgi:uncharacterized membrane protein HdeD (DUF308 family)